MDFKNCRTMLYKALKKPNGKVVVTDPEFLSHTTKIVATEGEWLMAKSLGWADDPMAALDLFEKEEQEIGQQAAHRAYDDRNMSEAAQAEAKAYEESVPRHVPVIPEQVKPPKPTIHLTETDFKTETPEPAKKRGRPKKESA